MSISEKIKTINQNKAQYDLDRQTVKISALSLGNVSEYDILTSKDLLLVKEILKKASTMKIFEYSSLGKELKVQNNVAKNSIKS